MPLIQNGYGGQVHRTLESGLTACNSRIYGWGVKTIPVGQDGTATVKVRRLCGNCFSVRNIEVTVSAESRIPQQPSR